jgi:NhaA family Na+:H+ antiporter
MLPKISISALTKSEVVSGILIIINFILAIFMANIDLLSQYYNNFVFYPISFGIGVSTYKTNIIQIMNDGLMTFFFLLIGLELKYHLVLGEFTKKKYLILPTAAAIGGIVVPALVYLFFNFNKFSEEGWAIPIATDTAFVIGILSFFHKHVSTGLRAFVIGFSLIDDILALLILVIFYTKNPNFTAFSLSVSVLLSMIVLNQFKVKNSIYYLILGLFLWVTMMQAGIHGTLSGAIIALIIPVKTHGVINPSFEKLENMLRPIVNFYIIPFFVFVNSGIKFDFLSKNILFSDISLGIILGLFIGKPIGIFGFSYFAVRQQWCHLPRGVNWSKLFSIALLSGIGFTLSLFIGDIIFETKLPNYTMRISIIIGSVLSAFFGTLFFYHATKNENPNA